MMRRLLIACVLTAGAAVALQANHPATFVMRSGVRISGDLSYKGGTTYTLSGHDYESTEVAAILFVSGDPSAAELRQIPLVDNNPSEHERHVFVTKDGKVTLGKLYKFSPDGETATYDAQEGGRREVSANDLARIYINPAAARSVYSAILTSDTRATGTAVRGDTGNGRPGSNNGNGDRNNRQPGSNNGGNGDRNDRRPGFDNGRDGDRDDRQSSDNFGAGNNTRRGGISVSGNRPWTDTGIEVRRGDLVSFSATGEVTVQTGNSRQRQTVAGPDGAVRIRESRNNYPYPDMAVGGLIARVGRGRAFGVGTITEPISMPDNGRLYLGINDDEFGDNGGAFSVGIRMNRSSR